LRQNCANKKLVSDVKFPLNAFCRNYRASFVRSAPAVLLVLPKIYHLAFLKLSVPLFVVRAGGLFLLRVCNSGALVLSI
jgi:hypothetical protein